MYHPITTKQYKWISNILEYLQDPEGEFTGKVFHYSKKYKLWDWVESGKITSLDQSRSSSISPKKLIELLSTIRSYELYGDQEIHLLNVLAEADSLRLLNQSRKKKLK